MKSQNQLLTQQSNPNSLEQPQEKGAIGIAFLVWLLGGGLGLAVIVFILAKIF